MQNYAQDEWDDSGLDDGYAAVDPLDGLTKAEEDILFRAIDLMPDGTREALIGYVMDHPRVIRALVDNIKQKKELIKNKDVEGIKQLLAREKIVLEEIDTQEGTTLDA